MKRVLAVSLISLIGCAPTVPRFDAGIAITDVTVIDVVDGIRTPGRTVIVEGDRIVAVRPAADVELGEGVVRVDGAGRVLIPGLWDMHAHVITPSGDPDSPLKLFIANGVTGVREMWGVVDVGLEISETIRNGERVGPRLVVPGTIVDGVPTWWPGSSGVATAREAAALVDSLADAGAAFVKVYSVLERDVYHAIVERATDRGLPVAGHVPFSVTAREAADAGQASMAHTFALPEGCSTAEQGVHDTRRQWLSERAAGSFVGNPFFDTGLYSRLLDGFDEDRCAALFDHLATTGSWQVPTLSVNRSLTFADLPEYTDDPLLEYLPAGVRQGWAGMSAAKAGESDADRAIERRFYEMQVDMVRRAHAAGVPILAGTDTPNPYVLPGFGLHRELELLLTAGLSPLAALQSATIGPAMFLGLEDSLGTIEVGKLADLVLLDGDPLEDIRNTARIAAVVAGGRLYDRAALDGLLSSVKDQASGN